MNADHDYQIGKDHTVCEDYATSGVVDDFAFAIVCDGCSSSNDVDFGARVLALAARENLRRIKNLSTRETDLKVMDHESFGHLTVRKADLISAIYTCLHPDFLDSTLLVAWVHKQKLTAFIYGDGVIIHKRANQVRACHIDYKVMMDGVEKPAPFYLSYYLNESNSRKYEKLPGRKIVYDGIREGNAPWVGGDIDTDKMKPFVFETGVEPGDVIAICSDGINTFRKPDNEPIPWLELVDDYTGFKTTEGVFARRRMNAFKRKCQKELITHSDDISIAAIVV